MKKIAGYSILIILAGMYLAFLISKHGVLISVGAIVGITIVSYLIILAIDLINSK